MLLYPSIDELTEKVDSKYTLAVMASKRARDLIDKKPRLVETDKIKPISIATEEISEDMISYKRVATSTETVSCAETPEVSAQAGDALESEEVPSDEAAKATEIAEE